MRERNSLLLLSATLLLVIFFLASNSKNEQTEIAKRKEETKNIQTAEDKAREEARKPRPPTDPSLCKDNPEGYLYFKVGDELFRTNKDSPLIIGGVIPELDEHHKPKLNATGIPKGCKGNPLKAGNTGDFYFERNYKTGRDDLIITAELEAFRFGIDEVPQHDYQRLTYSLYSMKNFVWDKRNKIYQDGNFGDDGDFICEDAAENLTHCKHKSLEQDLRSKFGLYIANPAVTRSAQDLPFVFDCTPAIPEIECKAYYRLYPTVNLEYSINFQNPLNFKPQTFLHLDQYMRQMYESMRVKGTAISK